MTDEKTSPIYGGEQLVSGKPRHLVVIEPLADRSAMAHKERIIVLDSDVRDAMAKARARLEQEARKYSQSGYVWDTDDIVYEHGGHRIITATLRVARPGE